jgi:hypothetical protein
MPPLTTMSTQPTIAHTRAQSGADRPFFRLPPVGASSFVGFPLLVTRSSVLPVGVPRDPNMITGPRTLAAKSIRT